MRLDSTERSVWVCQIRRSGSPLPYCIAPGDSGGGLWAKASDGNTVLIGVNSYTATTAKTTRSRAGEESGHTRVSLYREWIRDIAGELDTSCTLAGCQPQ
jgi:secreted trypsin-like serine protease